MNEFNFKDLALFMFTHRIVRVEFDFEGVNDAYLMNVFYENGTTCVHAIGKEEKE